MDLLFHAAHNGLGSASFRGVVRGYHETVLCQNERFSYSHGIPQSFMLQVTVLARYTSLADNHEYFDGYEGSPGLSAFHQAKSDAERLPVGDSRESSCVN